MMSDFENIINALQSDIDWWITQLDDIEDGRWKLLHNGEDVTADWAEKYRDRIVIHQKLIEAYWLKSS